MLKLAKKIVTVLEDAPLSFPFWIITFASIVTTRLLVENWLTMLKNRTGFFLFYEFSHTWLFFLMAYLLFAILLRLALSIEWKKVFTILLWGYIVIIFPPIIDFIISGGKGYWSFYEFDGLKGLVIRFFTFFGSTPEIGVTYGVRIEVALAVLFIGIYSYLKLHRFFRAFFIALISYGILFILGTFPAWVTIAIKGFPKGIFNVNEIDVAQMFLSPVSIFSREIPDIISALNVKMSLVYAPLLSIIILIGLFLFTREKFLAFVRNARVPQLIYHAGLILVGAGLSFLFTEPKEATLWSSLDFFSLLSLLIIIEAAWCAWLSSVVINDSIDQRVDKITNNNRPLIKKIFSPRQYHLIGAVLFFVSLFLAAIVNFKIVFLLTAYQALAWIYSAWPLRLKRFPLVATFISALASLLILFSGFILVSPDQNIHNLPFSLILLLAIGYTFSLPVKDFKDIEGDRADNIYSVPVLFGEQWGKIIISCGIFLSFILSVVIMNEFRLFWWALILGAISFWLVVNMKNKASESLVNYRNIFWWILGIVAVYGIIVIKITL